MFLWIQTVFADPSDIARFLAILVSGLIALFVVFINHYLVNARESVAFNKLKMEELYSASLETKRLFCSWMRIPELEYSKPKVTDDHGLEFSFGNIRLLATLYLDKDSCIEVLQVLLNARKSIDKLRNSLENKNIIKIELAYKESLNSIETLVTVVSDVCITNAVKKDPYVFLK
jgi:hypothetical protein